MDEKRIAKLMETLLCSREEAISVIEDDKRIDKGEKLFEFETAEQKKAAKAATITTGNAPLKSERKPREKKANADKAELIAVLLKSLDEMATDVSVLNDEREFTFKYNDTKYKVVLSAPRS